MVMVMVGAGSRWQKYPFNTVDTNETGTANHLRRRSQTGIKNKIKQFSLIYGQRYHFFILKLNFL